MKNYNIIRVLAFDPGINHCGWSLHEYNIATDTDVVVKFGTIHGQQSLKFNKDKLLHFDKQFIMLTAFEATVKNLIREHKPHYVVSESAFAHLFMATFAVLTLVIYAIRRSFAEIVQRNISTIAPKEAKKSLSGDGTANKQTIQDAVLNHPKIKIRDTKQHPVTTMTEHEADSIGVGFSFTRLILPTEIAAGHHKDRIDHVDEIYATLVSSDATKLPVLIPVEPVVLKFVS